jgi:hypothetical protein
VERRQKKLFLEGIVEPVTEHWSFESPSCNLPILFLGGSWLVDPMNMRS